MSTQKNEARTPISWDFEWRVRKVAAEECGVDFEKVSLDSHLFDDLNADSLALIGLIMELEDEFGVDISDQAAQRIFTQSPPTLRTLANYIGERQECGSRPQKARTAEQSDPIRTDELPFTQLGPAKVSGLKGSLYKEIGPNAEGYGQ